MLSFLCIEILAIFFIIGLVEIIKKITLNFFKQTDNNKIIILISLKGHEEKAEFLIRSAITKLKYIGQSGAQKIICLDYNMDDETRKICEIFKNKYSIISIHPAEEFTGIF